ncbi:hypothetical protein SBOR_1528 [Sclerotinia borealis F-4128]|uniref:Uncharacterized protein n=1 Tax=Sclerotinia borealis (strain F-4128) TaxID=1432307 RepID=W9CMP5_SCLBF|nr:hypothetical protein SBOR_1528 [Sclerotinia borealis F-4128]
MKGFLRAPLLVVVGWASLAQGYQHVPKDLSDIIAALEGAQGGKGEVTTVTAAAAAAAVKTVTAAAVTKEITMTMTVTKSIQGAAVQAAGTGGQFSFLTSTVFASGAPPTVTVTPIPQMITQTVTEQVMVTMMATQMSVVTSMVTMTMMQTITMMVSVTMQGATTVASASTALSQAAIQGATTATTKASASTALSQAAIQGATVASVTTSAVSSAVSQAGASSAPVLGAAQVAQPSPVDINTFSLSSSLVLGNLAVSTSV